ncbi:trans-resveratrol di-O-methyltransferase-like [Carex rostrata]
MELPNRNESTKGMITTNELKNFQALIIHETQTVVGMMALKCAVDLGIPNQIRTYDTHMPLHDLARAISIPPSKDPMLRRLMRVLVKKGYFEEPEEATYCLTPISHTLLREGSTTSMTSAVRMLCETMVRPMHFFSDWFKVEGSSPFEMANGGKTLWEIVSEKPEINCLFNEGMADRCTQMVKGAVQQYPELFHGAKTLVDVGGGNGTTARIIAEAFPELRCTVFDLPHVIATLPESKLFGKVAGDMFEAIPPADVVVLQNVLHDLSDEECVKILNRSKEAISKNGAGGKIIIMDIVVNMESDVPKAAETSLLFDLSMMILFNGKERDEQEWKNIFREVGYSQYKLYPTVGVGSIIELYL